MKRFSNFLIEEYEFLVLILEGKGQRQVIQQFGPKILNLMQRDHGRLGESGDLPGTAHYAKFAHEPGHGTVEHMHDYIMKHMGLPESPSYLNIQKPEDANTWNQHLNWILTRYAQGDQSGNAGIQRLEDIHHRALPALARYHGLVQQGKMDKSSLAKWKNLGHMEDALQNADPLQAGKLNDAEYHVHDENEHWSLVTPHTSEAACTLGHGTKWCTTSGAFEQYSKDGPLYIMIPKKPQHKNEKYQLHIESKQLMDKDDREAEIEDISTKDRPVTPKMSALLKLHTNARRDSFSPEEQDFLIDQHPYVAVQQGMKDRLTKAQTLKVLSDGSPLDMGDKINLAKTSKNIDSEAITHILNNSDDEKRWAGKLSYHPHIVSALLRTPHLAPLFTREHFETIAKAGHSALTKDAAAHENIPHDILDQFKQSSDPDLRLAAMTNKNTTTDELVKYLGETQDSPHARTRELDLESRVTSLISHPNLPKDVFDDIFDFAADPSTHEPRTELGAKVAKELAAPDMRDFVNVAQRKNERHDMMRGTILTQALKSPHHEERHLDRMVDFHVSGPRSHNFRQDLSSSILYSPKVTEEHIIKMIENAPQSTTTDRPSKHINTMDIFGDGGKRITPRILDALTTHVELDHPGSFEKIIKHPLFGESQKQILRDRLAAQPRPHHNATYYESLMNGEQ